MKKTTLLCYLIINLSLVNNLSSQSTPDSLFGGWKLIRISGGFAGQGNSNWNHNAILFSSDCKFKAYLKNTLKSSSDFSLWKSTSIYSSTDSVYNIRIEDKFPFWGSFTVYNDILYIRDEMHDGFTYVYQRIYTKQQIDNHFKNAKH